MLLRCRHTHDFSSLAKFCGIHHCVLFAYFHHIKFCLKKIRLELFLLEPPRQSAHEGKAHVSLPLTARSSLSGP